MCGTWWWIDDDDIVIVIIGSWRNIDVRVGAVHEYVTIVAIVITLIYCPSRHTLRQRLHWVL
jgi:hypothetical protein